MNPPEQNQVREGVTAVIPAYNEADNIGCVLRVLQDVKELNEILVVDDGSEDQTAEIVNHKHALDKRISLLSLPENRGKGNAMMAGADAARNDLLLFLDADLRDLEPHHIRTLLHPVQSGSRAIAVGLFEDGRWQTNITHSLFPFLSGQRCLRWSCFKDIYRENMNGWSIETAINLHANVNNHAVKYVMWPGVTHAIRTEKIGRSAGLWSHVKMWSEIGRYVVNFYGHRMRQSWQTEHRVLPLAEYEQGR